MGLVDACVGTDKLFRERFSVLPEMKSKFVQTDASWLRSRSIATNTDVDPAFVMARRRRVRGTHSPAFPVRSVTASSRETQTDVSFPLMRDASAQVNICCRNDLLNLSVGEKTSRPAMAIIDESIVTAEPMLVEQSPDAHAIESPKPSQSLTSLSSIEMDASPEPQTERKTVDQASSPMIADSPSPPPPPPPPECLNPKSLIPLPAIEVVITPPPPIAVCSPDTGRVSAASPGMRLPPAARARSTVTSGTNSQNASDEDEDEAEIKRFKSLRDEEFFKKYATRPRRGTLTLRTVKAKSESRRPSAVTSPNEPSSHQTDNETSNVEAASGGVAMPSEPITEAVAATSIPPMATSERESPQGKISNVSVDVPAIIENVPLASKAVVTKEAEHKSEATATPLIRKSTGGKEFTEKLKDPDAPENESLKKKKEVLSASSPNLLSDESTGTSIVEAVDVNEADVKTESGDSKNQLVMKMFPREMRTESKIVIEVINARRREVSEVTSYSEMQPDGKITRKTTVTTSKKVPVMAIGPSAGVKDAPDSRLPDQRFPQRRHPGKTPDPIVTSPLSTKATSSPVPRHANMTSMQSVAPSEASTRPTSAADEVTISSATTPASSHPDSFTSSAASPDIMQRSGGSSFLQTAEQSQFLTPAYSDPDVEKVAKLMHQVFDPYHLIMQETDIDKNLTAQSVPTTLSRKPKRSKEEPASTAPTPAIADRDECRAKSPPLTSEIETSPAAQTLRPKPRVYWHETSHSSVTNEMVTDVYRDDSGTVVRPKGVTMHSETVIDSMGKDGKVRTRSKAQRQFAGHIQEPEITAETTVCDEPPILQMEPRRPGFPRRVQTLALPQVSERAVQKSQSSADEKRDKVEAQTESSPEKRIPSSRIPRCTPVATATPLDVPMASGPVLDRKKRMKSDPGKISVKSSGFNSAESTTAMSTPLKSTSRTSIKSPVTFMESSLDHLDDSDIAIPDVLSPNILSTDVSSRDPESRVDSGLLSSPRSPAGKKSRREKIIESARKGHLFSEVNKALNGKSLSFADLNGQSAGVTSRKSSVDHLMPQSMPMSGGIPKVHPKLRSSNDLDKVLPILPSLTSSKSGTELVTKITRRTQPAEFVDLNGSKILRPKRDKMVLEQDIRTGDGTYDTTGCHLMNRVTVDNPCVKKKKSKNPFGSFTLNKLMRKSSQPQLAIASDDNEKENGATAGKRKSGKPVSGKKDISGISKSMGDLRAASDDDEEEGTSAADGKKEGVMLTETKFERLVPNPATGRSNHQTCWQYSLECKCINGLNTSVKTNVKHRRSYVPMGLTLYESSV